MKKRWSANLRKKILWITIALLAVIIVLVVIFIPEVSSHCQRLLSVLPHKEKTISLYEAEWWTKDDQRSTLWPLLVSLIVAMLGTLITTYIFLKGSLDRTLDDHPYYKVVITQYRKETMEHMWRYTVLTLLLITGISLLYCLLYFFALRSHYSIRGFLFLMTLVCLIYSAKILKSCIFAEKGLHSTAKRLLLKRIMDAQKYIYNRNQIRRVQFLLKMFKINVSDLTDSWMKTQPGRNGVDKRQIDASQIILMFQYWEKLYMSLIRQDDSSSQPPPQQVLLSVERGIKIYKEAQKQDMEQMDAEFNCWNTAAYKLILGFQHYLAGREDCSESSNSLGHQIHDMSVIRDLLRVLIETSEVPRAGNEEANRLLQPHINAVYDIIFSFTAGVSAFLLRIPARFEIFFPLGRFIAANFYNVRIQDSALRASWFTCSVFARTKLVNCNFGTVRFDRCEFFSADSRNCSFSNAMFDVCGLRSAIFENVDFTGADLRECDLEGASFRDSILQNMTLMEIHLKNCSLENCKIVQPEIRFSIDQDDCSICNLNLTGSTISDLNVYIEGLPDAEEPACSAEINADSPSLVYQFLLNIRQMQDILKKAEIQDSLEESCTCLGYFRDKAKQLNIDYYGKPFYGSTPKNHFQNENNSDAVWNAIQQYALIAMGECIFSKTVLIDFPLYRVNLDQSIFLDAQMKGATLFCVYMPGCIMERSNMRESLLWGVVMESAVLNNAYFYKAECTLVNLEDSSLIELHASGAKFCCCSFNRSNCEQIDLTNACLDACSFRDSILTKAELTGSKFQTVRMDNLSASGMLASYTEFNDCTLTNAYLSHSSFNYAVFVDCDFSLSSFSRSAVTNVKFVGCSFKNADFSSTSFAQAEFLDCSHMETARWDSCRFVQTSFLGANEGFEKKLPETASVIN